MVEGRSSGEVWALALSPTGNFMAATTYNGRVCVYDVPGTGEKVREYETKGSFGMSVDIVRAPAIAIVFLLYFRIQMSHPA